MSRSSHNVNFWRHCKWPGDSAQVVPFMHMCKSKAPMDHYSRWKNDSTFRAATRPAASVRCILSEATMWKKPCPLVSMKLIIRVYICFFKRMGLILRKLFKDYWRTASHRIHGKILGFFGFSLEPDNPSSQACRSTRQCQWGEPALGEDSCSCGVLHSPKVSSPKIRVIYLCDGIVICC